MKKVLFVVILVIRPLCSMQGIVPSISRALTVLSKKPTALVCFSKSVLSPEEQVEYWKELYAAASAQAVHANDLEAGLLQANDENQELRRKLSRTRELTDHIKGASYIRTCGGLYLSGPRITEILGATRGITLKVAPNCAALRKLEKEMLAILSGATLE